jgi:hypothetical protein
MLKLGEYYEKDAKAIADHLEKAGIRVDLRPSIEASIETKDILQGRFSELKTEIKEKNVVEDYERYLNNLKKTLLEKPAPEYFEQKYLTDLFPSLDEIRKTMREALEDAPEEFEEEGDELGEYDIGTETLVGENANELPTEQIYQMADSEGITEQSDDMSTEMIPETASEIAEIIVNGAKALAFARSALSLNDIEIGEDIGNRLEDPIVTIPVDRDDYGLDHPQAKRVISVYLNKCYDLYVDEFSVVFADMPDEEFIKRYTDENIKLGSLKLFFTNLIENHSSEKMDSQIFEDECRFEADTGKSVLRVVGYPVAREIAKVLEKNGVIKIKGNIIRWKK